MTYLAAVLDLCIWAGEGFDGFEKWLSMPPNIQELWWQHWNNTRSGAYNVKDREEKTTVERMKESDDAEKRWLAAINAKRNQ